MHKFYFLIIVLFLSTTLLAQVKVAELPIKYSSDFYNNKESLVISNEESNELVVLIEDYKKTSVCLLDNEFKTISTLEIESLPKSFKLFLGYSLVGNEYSIFFSNNIKTKFGVLKVNFKTNLIVNKKIDFKLTGEKYVQSISFKNKYYLVSISSKPSQLHFYEFRNKFSEDNKYSIDFSFVDKQTNDDYNLSAKKLIVGKQLGSSKRKSLARIDESTPNSIEVSSNKNKLYIIDDKFVFTFDHEKEETKVVVVDPKDFSVKKIKFDKPEINSEFLKHNSYLHSGKLYQIQCNSSLMKFTIKDFLSKKLLKEIILNKKDSITFKNTPVLQEKTGGIYAGKREFEKTSKFLRKISQGDIGVSVYKNIEGNYNITMGSRKEIKNNGGSGFGTIPIGGFGALGAIGAVNFNPTLFAYGSYSNTKSVRVDCLFDNDFNHVKGIVKDNIFDEIRSFEDNLSKVTYDKNGTNDFSTIDVSSDYFKQDEKVKDSYSFKKGGVKLKNVFVHNNKYYFSFLSSKDKNYHIIEF